MNSYEDPVFSETCELYHEVDRLKSSLEAAESRAEQAEAERDYLAEMLEVIGLKDRKTDQGSALYWIGYARQQVQKGIPLPVPSHLE